MLERTNARAIAAADLPYAPDLVVADVSFISLAKVLPAVLACCAERFDALAMVKPQFEVGRERVGKGGVVRSPDGPPGGARRGRAGRARARRRGARLRLVGPAGAEGQPRDVRVAGRGGARRAPIWISTRLAREVEP